MRSMGSHHSRRLQEFADCAEQTNCQDTRSHSYGGPASTEDASLEPLCGLLMHMAGEDKHASAFMYNTCIL